MVEPLINHWTIEHLLFGLGTGIVIHFLLKTKYRFFLISSSVIMLWELFEYRNSASYWLSNYANNLMDILVGLIGIVAIQALISLINKLRV